MGVLLVRRKWLRNHLQSMYEEDDISKHLNRASIHHGRCCRGVMCYDGTNQQFPLHVCPDWCNVCGDRERCSNNHLKPNINKNNNFVTNASYIHTLLQKLPWNMNASHAHTHTHPSQHHRLHVQSILPFVPKLWCGIIARGVFLVNIMMSQWSWLVILGS